MYEKIEFKNNVKQSHKKYFILTAFFPKQAFISSVLVIFYINRLNISFSEYLILDTVLSFALAITEIPSGFIADYFGRKKILIIALFIDLISMLVLLVSNSFTGGLLSVILLSLGLSLGSGNAQSILYEFYDTIDEVENYKKLNSNANSIMLVCISLYSITSGFIFKIGMDYILYLDILFILFNILITHIFLIDNKPNGRIQSEQKKKKVFDMSVVKLKLIGKTLPVFISLALLFSFFRVTFNYYQPIYENFNIPVEVFGFFPIIFNGLASLGSQLYKRIIGEIKKERVQVYVISSILLFSVIGIYIFRYSIVGIAVAICLQQICRGANMSLQPVMMNGVIPKNTNYRTMYISFFSMINTLLIFLLNLLSIIVLGYVELFAALFVVSLAIILILITVTIIKIEPKIINEVT